MPAPKTIAARLWDRVRRDESSADACWEWTGGQLRRGYGSVGRINGKSYQAHRLSYELAYGPIPDGVHVCHRCDNPRCVRPDHLFLGTRRDNMRDMEHKGRADHPRGARHGQHTKPERRQVGEINGRAKLTATDVCAIRARAALGESLKRIAQEFGISDTHAGCIVHRKNWRHL